MRGDYSSVMLETRVTGAGARDDVVQSPPRAGDCHCLIDKTKLRNVVSIDL